MQRALGFDEASNYWMRWLTRRAMHAGPLARAGAPSASAPKRLANGGGFGGSSPFPDFAQILGGAPAPPPPPLGAAAITTTNNESTNRPAGTPGGELPEMPETSASVASSHLCDSTCMFANRVPLYPTHSLQSKANVGTWELAQLPHEHIFGSTRLFLSNYIPLST